MSSGKITQVIGPVVDVEFASGATLPEINNALIVYKDVDGVKTKIVLEVALELGDGAVRTIAMESTDGLTRGLEVLDTGKAISVPVGQETLGRVFNVLGDAIDGGEAFAENAERSPIHKKRHLLMNFPQQMKFLLQGLKLLTYLPHTLKVVRLACSGVPELVKPFLSKN